MKIFLSALDNFSLTLSLEAELTRLQVMSYSLSICLDTFNRLHKGGKWRSNVKYTMSRAAASDQHQVAWDIKTSSQTSSSFPSQVNEWSSLTIFLWSHWHLFDLNTQLRKKIESQQTQAHFSNSPLADVTSKAHVDLKGTRSCHKKWVWRMLRDKQEEGNEEDRSVSKLAVVSLHPVLSQTWSSRMLGGLTSSLTYLFSYESLKEKASVQTSKVFVCSCVVSLARLNWINGTDT